MSSLAKSIKRSPLMRMFSMDKLVRNSLLNKIGVQPARVALAQGRHRLRPRKVSPEVATHLKALETDGMVVIPKFLEEGDFDAVAKECRKLVDEGITTYSRQMGSNVVTNTNLKDLSPEEYPALRRLITNPTLRNLFVGAERRDINLDSDNFEVLLQRLVQGDDDVFDPESAMHVDTFFNTHKAWLYIDDVSLENGPFCYVKGTHRLSASDRLSKAYQYSQNVDEPGSRRISEEEMRKLGLEETVVTCDKNTLVLGNTFGFHRRLKGENGRDRLTFAVSARYNPFF